MELPADIIDNIFPIKSTWYRCSPAIAAFGGDNRPVFAAFLRIQG
jgi:hypothetical protein